MDVFENYAKAKQELTDYILNDSTKDEYEKLCLIDKHSLFGVDSFICHPFKCFEEEYRATLKELYPDKQSFAIVDFINDGGYLNRHETIFIHNIIEGLYDEEDETIEVLTVRGAAVKDAPAYVMKRDDVRKHLYNWCVTNKLIGYQFDW